MKKKVTTKLKFIQIQKSTDYNLQFSQNKHFGIHETANYSYVDEMAKHMKIFNKQPYYRRQQSIIFRIRIGHCKLTQKSLFININYRTTTNLWRYQWTQIYTIIKFPIINILLYLLYFLKMSCNLKYKFEERILAVGCGNIEVSIRII